MDKDKRKRAASRGAPTRPAVTSKQHLPFGDLTPKDFEQLCCDLARTEAGVEDCKLYGCSGELQEGIDIIVTLANGNHETWQAKRYSRFTTTDLAQAIEAFEGGSWVKSTTRFVIATSAPIQNTALQKALLKHAAKLLSKYGVKLKLYGAKELASELKSKPAIVSNFFGADWTNVFCPRQTLTRPDLPPKPSRCFDRVEETSELACLLRGSGDFAVILLGPGGIGKTTLAREVATSEAAMCRFGNARWELSLRSVRDVETLRTTFTHEFGLPDALKLRDVASALGTMFKERPGLLLLDNVETVWESDNSAVGRFLQQLVQVPGLSILATMIGTERPLDVSWTKLCYLKPLSPAGARKLFLDIAYKIDKEDPNLDVFLTNLGGLPLALFLVAHYAQSRTTLAMVRSAWERAGRQLFENTGHSGDDPHRSLAQSITLSLSARRVGHAGHRLFAVLGQLPGGVADSDLPRLLGEAGLTGQFELLRVGLAFQSPGDRTDLLPPIRDYAQLRYRPLRCDQFRWTYHYLELARIEGQKLGSKDGRRALERVDPEVANMTAAFAHIAGAGKLRAALVAIEGFGRVLMFSGRGDGSALELLKSACRSHAHLAGTARCGYVLGTLNRWRYDVDAAIPLLKEALVIRGFLGDLKEAGRCACSLAEAVRVQGDQDEALARFNQAIDFLQRAEELCPSPANLNGIATAYQGLGKIEGDKALRVSGPHDIPDFSVCIGHYRAGLELYRRTGNRHGQANCHGALADWILLGAERGRNSEPAREGHKTAYNLFVEVADAQGVVGSAIALASIDLRIEKFASASKWLDMALELSIERKHSVGIAACWEATAAIEFARSETVNLRAQQPTAHVADHAYHTAAAAFAHCNFKQNEATMLSRISSARRRNLTEREER